MQSFLCEFHHPTNTVVARLAALRNTMVFGAALETSPSLVPSVVRKCIAFVESEGLDAEGIYRISGSTSNMARLRVEFNSHADDVLLTVTQLCTPYDAAGLLKQFFRELPEPLLTNRLRDAFVTVRVCPASN